MENATKALLIAGGVLIALLIIGAFLLMFNTLGDYQTSVDATKAEEQLAKFNNEYVSMVSDSDLTGVKIISAANKIDDYNKNETAIGKIEWSEITLNIDLTNASEEIKKILGATTQTKITQEQFCEKIKDLSDAERSLGISTMNKITSNIDQIYASKDEDTIRANLQEVTGKKNVYIDEVTAENYYQYTLLKKAKFEFTGETYNATGKISELTVAIK